MKKSNNWWLIAGIAIFTLVSFSACEKPTQVENSPQDDEQNLLSTLDTTRTSTSSPYLITLESIDDNGDGTFTWSWSAKNPDPNTSTGGTIPDLSYIGVSLGQTATSSDVASAATSTDGVNWTPITVLYRQDFGQTCYTGPVITISLNTRDTLASYYRITVNRNFEISDEVDAVYQSTRIGDCGAFQMSSFGNIAVVPAGCAYPVSHFFAKRYVWGTNVTVGGFNYTQKEANAIYSSSDKKGLKDSKKCFLQVLAIKLSGTNVDPAATVWADVAIAENYLATLGKLSPNNLPTGNATASAAADRIKTWIDQHTCQ